jgi:hypothetical protein
MLDDKVFDWFCAAFKGNTGFFVKHQAPFIEKEGKLKASRCGFAVYNKQNPPPEGKEDGELIPVTKELYREHLNGGDGLAIAPLTNTKEKKNVCFYAAIDIDVYDVNFTRLVNKLYHAGLKFAAFLSKSGGLHIYFFFKYPEPGDKAIEALERIVAVYGLRKLFVNKDSKSKVEIFPKQKTFIPGNGVVNCLFLPFYNAANGGRQKLLTAEGKLVGIVKAPSIIKNMYTSVKEINGALDELLYGDAPYCVQMILLTGVLAENDGRNNFLFSAAIYLKKKYKEDFKEYLREMNDCLEAPLERRDIDSIYTSVTTKGYDKYSCKKSPCADYCDKKLCAAREYGVGKQRDNHFTGADCWGELTKVMAKEPYYLWQVRVNPDDEFKPVRVDSVKDLRNQTAMQECCWRHLNWAPFRVKDNDWVATVNKAMEGIADREVPVPKGTDTTEEGGLHDLFVQYLTHRQAPNGMPTMVQFGKVYHAEGVYYFTTKGIVDFLRFEKFSLGKINLHESLAEYGCAYGELPYRNIKGEEKVIECWTKPDDEELLRMNAFYEDVYAEGERIMREIEPDEARKGGGNGDDTKF